jgi:hypothetical protein
MAVGLRERLQKYKYVTHTIVAMVAGLALIYAAARFRAHPMAHDVLNEFGIGIVIAAIVTLMYETYAREVLASETMSKVVASVMGDMFDTQLWDEMRLQLLRKTAVRRGFSVRIALERDDRLGDGKAVLWVSLLYRLHPLRPKTDRLKIYHYLDKFMHDDTTGLPRFTDISVGSQVVDPREIRDKFEQDIDIDEWPDGIPVIVERREIIYLPGAYNLIMSDLTAVEIIRVEDLPQDINVEIYWTLEEPHIMHAFEARHVRRMFLPGHAIEFRFNRKPPATQGHAAGTAA